MDDGSSAGKNLKKESPSGTKGFFYGYFESFSIPKKLLHASVILILAGVLSGTKFVNFYDKNEEKEVTVTAVVSLIQNNYIALVYSDNEKGTQEELEFERNPDVRVI